MLSSVLFDARETLPKTSAIYFALSIHGDVLYIGATNDRRQRWRTHQRIPRLQELGCTKSAQIVHFLEHAVARDRASQAAQAGENA